MSGRLRGPTVRQFGYCCGLDDYATIYAGYRSQLREEFQILGVVERGFAKGLQGTGFGWSGFIVNCPVVFRLL